VKKKKEIWKCTLTAKMGNERVSFDENIEEICERCATIIHYCISITKQGWEPDFNEYENTAAVAAGGAEQPTMLPGA